MSTRNINFFLPLLFFLAIYPLFLFSQDSLTIEQNKILSVNGYIKDMQSLTYDKNFENLITNNLIHNRINLRFDFTSSFKGAAEFRNRLYWGEEVALIPDFSDLLANEGESVNLSKVWIQKESLVFITNVERLWMEYHSEKWLTRIGRQRINWGISTTWNPNDIFNAYNFLDFDYEERSGRDALKFTYLHTDMSSIDIAVAIENQIEETVAAVKYFINTSGYDFQFSGGIYFEQFTAGAGWSGHIADAGFKGEVQYFAPYHEEVSQTNFTMETDYLFNNGWYMNMGFLLNTSGINKELEDLSMINFQVSPKSLMPTKWNFILTVSKEITPLLIGNLSTFYSPGSNMVFILPSIQFNMASNLDVNIIWQSYYAELNDSFEAMSHNGFIRFKWSF